MVAPIELVGLAVSVGAIGITVKFVVDSVETIITASMVITRIVGFIGTESYPESAVFSGILSAGFVLFIALVVILAFESQ